MKEEFRGREDLLPYTQDLLNYFLESVAVPASGEASKDCSVSQQPADPHENNILTSYML